MSLHIPEHLEKKRNIAITEEELIQFEAKVADAYEAGQIKGPVHLAKNNERYLTKMIGYSFHGEIIIMLCYME